MSVRVLSFALAALAGSCVDVHGVAIEARKELVPADRNGQQQQPGDPDRGAATPPRDEPVNIAALHGGEKQACAVSEDGILYILDDESAGWRPAGPNLAQSSGGLFQAQDIYCADLQQIIVVGLALERRVGWIVELSGPARPTSAYEVLPVLHAIHGHGGRVIAAGDLDGAPVLLEREGLEAWRVVYRAGDPGGLLDVRVRNDGSALALGAGGLLLRSEQPFLFKEARLNDTTAQVVWGSPAEPIWVVAGEGLWVGSPEQGWRRKAIPPGGPITDVQGFSSAFVIALQGGVPLLMNLEPEPATVSSLQDLNGVTEPALRAHLLGATGTLLLGGKGLLARCALRRSDLTLECQNDVP